MQTSSGVEYELELIETPPVMQGRAWRFRDLRQQVDRELVLRIDTGETSWLKLEFQDEKTAKAVRMTLRYASDIDPKKGWIYALKVQGATVYVQKRRV